jgi:anaerobic selenocysteine-containing dehydrogenase
MPPAATELIRHRICPLCEACCGLELRLSNGEIKSIRGHQADVFSQGFICPKGAALKNLHEDPDRLRFPLIKRHGQFVEASWDEAFAEIERRLVPILQQHGRQAVASVVGNPTVHKFGLLLYFPRLARAIGSRNIFSASTLDQMPKQLSCGLMFGHWFSVPVPDIERTDFLLMLGANPLVSNGSMWTVPNFRGKAKAMQQRGGQLVVIDPRRTETASLADQHFFIRPGADAFLLLAMVQTLFAENLVRPGRLTNCINGIEEIKAAVADFAPEKVEARCGISAATIRTLARTLATTQRAAVYGRIGTCTQEFGTLTSWLIDVLNVLTGHLDEPGGAMFPKAAAFATNTIGKAGSGKGIITGRHHSRVSGAPEVFGELPVTCLAEEIETPGEGQVKALITIAGNPVLSAPNGERLSAALNQLELMVSADIYLNETTRHADVILPGTSPLEESHYDVAFPQLSCRNHARYSAPVFPRNSPQPAEWQTLLRLTAIVSGKGADANLTQLDDELTMAEVRRLAGDQTDVIMQQVSQWQGPERLLDLALRSGPYGDQFGKNPDGLNLEKLKAAEAGIDLGVLSPRVPEVLRTPSGKIELAPPVLIADVARAAADLTRPVPEFVIIGRRQLRSNNSWMHNLPVLTKGAFRCTALIHPEDAGRLGLQNGTMAHLSNDSKSIEAQIEISDEMMPGVISLPHGWGHHLTGTKLSLASERPGANINALLDENLRDPLSGNAVLSGVPIQISVIPAT